MRFFKHSNVKKGALGFATGFAIKKSAKLAVFGIGASLVVAQYLQSQGIIDVKWSNIEQKSAAILDINHDGRVNVDDVKALEVKGEHLLKNRYGLGAGFIFGFMTGIRFA
jgi:uncharacterized membrane protein (Fun14 family)